jgi:hypothetical protein
MPVVGELTRQRVTLINSPRSVLVRERMSEKLTFAERAEGLANAVESLDRYRARRGARDGRGAPALRVAARAAYGRAVAADLRPPFGAGVECFPLPPPTSRWLSCAGGAQVGLMLCGIQIQKSKFPRSRFSRHASYFSAVGIAVTPQKQAPHSTKRIDQRSFRLDLPAEAGRWRCRMVPLILRIRNFETLRQRGITLKNQNFGRPTVIAVK